ncbi:hypothetical protein R1flu_023157 [Riccia fluitans]|uniref:Uncharacterized protein n=1 Tax=Riccia fluitans TaxID=41844 RepID=A0ABD1XR82_9MARC
MGLLSARAQIARRSDHVNCLSETHRKAGAGTAHWALSELPILIARNQMKCLDTRRVLGSSRDVNPPLGGECACQGV